jgi:hypothetical protein
MKESHSTKPALTMNMRQTLLSLGLVFAAVVSNAQSTVTVNFAAGVGRGARDVTDHTGALMPVGNDVEIGFFNPGTDIAANTALGLQGIINLWSAWHPFGTTTIQQGFPDFTDGQFAGSASQANSLFDGKPIVLWIFKTTDNGAPNTTDFSNVLEYGLYSRTASGSAWTFLPSGLTPQSQDINTGQIDTSYFGAVNGGSTGTLGTSLAVPEPGSLSILALGFALVAFVNRGRR